MSRATSHAKIKSFPYRSCRRATHRVLVSRHDRPAENENVHLSHRAESDSRSMYTAFTLVEIMVVVAIIGTLAAIAIPTFTRSVYRAQVTRAINDIRVLGDQIDTFEIENGRVPDDLVEINRDGQIDPWGHPYVYMSFAAQGANWKGKARKDHSLVPLNTSYDLYSVGKDGKSSSPLTAKASADDVVRANDGGFIGLGADF